MPSDSDDSGDNVDWDSLKTVTTFDGTGGNVANSYDCVDGKASSRYSARASTGSGIGGSTQVVTGTFIEQITHNASTPVSLLVESLVQQLCSMLDTDPAKSSQLYLNICEQLHKMHLIDKTYAMGEFEVMRSQYQRALYQLVSVARGQELPVPVQSVWPLTQPVGMDWSRYHREFDEIAFVAGGGFGKVFKAKHKLDGIEYAVKKVTIKSITIGRILSHLAEVKTLASLNHQNVVSYKAAWLEPLLREPKGNENDDPNIHEDSGDDEEEEGEEEEDEVTGPEISASATTESRFDMEESSEFIHFETESKSNKTASRYASSKKLQLTRFQETSPHLNLKWATLYIQMTLCQWTLRQWMDERNKHEDFEEFYHKSWSDLMSTTHRTSSTTNLKVYEMQAGRGQKDTSNGCPVTPDFNQSAHEIFQQIVNGLDYIHGRGIVHHDIKPSNVFVGYEVNGQLTVQLGDFGLACPLQDEHGRDNVLGTPTYAAPEQLKGHCDPKSDIFSLGVVLLELLLQFSTDMERIKNIEQVRRQQVPEIVPSTYIQLMTSLVAVQPTTRPTTGQIIETLREIGRGENSATVEMQRQMDMLAEELQKLRHEIATNGDSPLLRDQLSSKDAEIRSKNSEIRRLQRQIYQLRRSVSEMSSKDAEIRRLKAMLLRKRTSCCEDDDDVPQTADT